MEKDKFGCVTCRELRTGGGQLVEIWCSLDDVDKVSEALKSVKNFDIRIPSTKQVKELSGGKYGQYTRYDVAQVKRGGSWLEVLQINDPPDGRCGNILLTWLSSAQEGRIFFEFDSIENACLAFEEELKVFGQKKAEQVLKMSGCLRMVKCGIFKPWFYAVADQTLWGDIVFPDTVKEDEVFQFGRKYVVEDIWKIRSIKTCVGVEHLVFKSNYERDITYRRVFWHDGMFRDCWLNDRKTWPKPLEGDELWIHEAIDSFRELISGARKKFEILFRDGSKFVGQWKPKNLNDKTWAGRYRTSLILEGGKEVDGEFEFTPTAEIPTAEGFLRKRASDQGVKIKEIRSLVRASGGASGKKWAGVF